MQGQGKNWLIGVGLLIGIGLGPEYLAGQGQRPDALLQQGQVALDAGQYAMAITAVQQVLQSTAPPRELARAFILLGNIFLEQGETSGARQQWLAARQWLQRVPAGRDSLEAKIENGLGEFALRSGDGRAAEGHHRKALALRQQVFGPKHPAVADSYSNLGNCYLAQGNYAQAEIYHQQALQLRQLLLPPWHPALAVSYTSLGTCALQQGQPTAAIAFYQKALRIRRQILGKQHSKVAITLNNLGRAHFAAGNWSAALSSYQEAVAIYQREGGNLAPNLAPLYENLGDLELERGETAAAATYFRQARLILGGTNPLAAGMLLHKIGLCQQAGQDLAGADSLHRQALASVLPLVGPQHPFAVAIANNLGNTLLAANRIAQAEQFLQQAWSGYPPSTIDETRNQLGNNLAVCWLRQGKWPAALQLLQGLEQESAALAPLAQAQTSKNLALAWHYLQAPSQARAALQRAQNQLQRQVRPTVDYLKEELSLLTVKGRILLEQGQRKAAIRSFARARTLAQAQRYRLSALARQWWGTEQYALYAGAIEANLAQWQHQHDEKALSTAFLLVEEYKSSSALEASQRPQALPPKIQAATQRLLELEKQRVALEQRGLSTLQTDQALTEVQQELSRWQQAEQKRPAQNRHPNGYLALPTLASLQQSLRPQEGFVTYFQLDRRWLVFVLTRRTLRAQVLQPPPGMIDSVAKFRRLLRSYPQLAGPAVAPAAAQWTQLAFFLHQQYLAPLWREGRYPSQLIVAPDGVLHYLPFDALLAQRPRDPLRFKTHAYLLRKTAVSYAYSASFLHQLRQRPTGWWLPRRLLALAPSFEKSQVGLLPLRHNRAEAQQIVALWGGKMLQDTQANLARFRQLAPQYAILHLATHGQAAAERSEYSYLAFTENAAGAAASLLYAEDLSQQRLPCQLVVLSACETGVGAFQHGEGIMGLSRGFFRAGVRSLVSTLWSVDDARTATLVVQFFRYLKQDYRKDEALRQAKLDFLAEHPHDEAHPFFWSGIVLHGSTKALPSGLPGWWLLGAPAAWWAWWFWRRRRQ